MSGGVMLGILIVVALSVAGAVMLRLLLSSPSIISWIGDTGVPMLRRRLHRRVVVRPANRPIQEIAVNLRRLGAVYYGGDPRRSWVKSEALRRAYDDVLAEACIALEIPTDLPDLEPGTERDAERLRVEHLLAAAGLVMRRAA